MEMKYALVFALLAIASLSYAASPNAAKGQGLSAAMDDVKCKNDFTIGVIDSIQSADPDGSGSLDAIASTLQADESKLQTYTDSKDVDGFRSYLKSNYNPDLRAAKSDVQDWRKSAKNLSNGTRESLRTSYNDLRTTYESCNLDAVKAHAQEKVQWYESELDNAGAKADNLSGRGIDTSNLETIISDARSGIVSPLSSVIDSATDAKGIQVALKQYCLYDGCTDGSNFHFAAKFESTKLDDILAKLNANPNAQNATAHIQAAQNDLSTAEGILSSLGLSQASDSQQTQLWNSIKDAATNVKEAISEMRSK